LWTSIDETRRGTRDDGREAVCASMTTETDANVDVAPQKTSEEAREEVEVDARDAAGDSEEYIPAENASEAGRRRRRTLWIGELAYWMDEAYVCYAFSSVYKTISHVKIIRNRQTGLNEGYGFVEFVTERDAEFALATFPGHLMPGTMHAFVLNWALIKPPSMREEEEEQEEDAEEETEEEEHPDVDEEGAAGETAPTLKSATSSRTVLAPVSESGSDTSADMSMDDTHRGEEESKGAEYSVFVGDLGQDVTEEVLTQLFKTKCSTACNARIVVDLKTLKSKGYGFIDFKTEEDYNVAMEELPGTRVGASKRPIRVSNAVERRTDTVGGIGDVPHDFEDLDPTNTTIFIGNLDVTVSGDELRAVFEPFGDVAYVKVTPKKGCAFVHFYRRPQAKAAMDAVHGMKLGAKHVRLSWGRHNTTKCAISSMLNGGQYLQYLPSPMAVPPQPMYVPTSHMVPSVFTGMRMPMTSAASVYSMYGGMHVMPPPPPVPLVAPES